MFKKKNALHIARVSDNELILPNSMSLVDYDDFICRFAAKFESMTSMKFSLPENWESELKLPIGYTAGLIAVEEIPIPISVVFGIEKTEKTRLMFVGLCYGTNFSFKQSVRDLFESRIPGELLSNSESGQFNFCAQYYFDARRNDVRKSCPPSSRSIEDFEGADHNRVIMYFENVIRRINKISVEAVEESIFASRN
jgi:hypothetical protein